MEPPSAWPTHRTEPPPPGAQPIGASCAFMRATRGLLPATASRPWRAGSRASPASGPPRPRSSATSTMTLGPARCVTRSASPVWRDGQASPPAACRQPRRFTSAPDQRHAVRLPRPAPYVRSSRLACATHTVIGLEGEPAAPSSSGRWPRPSSWSWSRSVSLYLFVHGGLGLAALLAIGVVTAVVYLVARPVAGVGVVVIAGAAAPPVAYVAGVLGTLIRADLLNLHRIRRMGAPVVSIGGPGTFDGILLGGVIAVLIASL